MSLAPVAPPERVAALDVLRGVALFGVLAANVHQLFSTRWIRPDLVMDQPRSTPPPRTSSSS